MDILIFLAQVIAISLSGVLAPGPVTTSSIVMGSKNRFAGSLIAVGHGIVEFPLIILITFGAAEFFKFKSAQIIIGIAGGAMLLFMAYGIYKSAKSIESQTGKIFTSKPILTGIVLSAGNPYFLVWWATVGLTLALQAKEIGIWAFAVFAVVHWLCDLSWYQILSWSSFKGASLLKGRGMNIVLIFCALAMGFFGIKFIADAIKLLIPQSS